MYQADPVFRYPVSNRQMYLLPPCTASAPSIAVLPCVQGGYQGPTYQEDPGGPYYPLRRTQEGHITLSGGHITL